VLFTELEIREPHLVLLHRCLGTRTCARQGIQVEEEHPKREAWYLQTGILNYNLHYYHYIVEDRTTDGFVKIPPSRHPGERRGPKPFDLAEFRLPPE
jgi:hypothetical protein